jgi:hypothetical protein
VHFEKEARKKGSRDPAYRPDSEDDYSSDEEEVESSRSSKKTRKPKNKAPSTRGRPLKGLGKGSFTNASGKSEKVVLSVILLNDLIEHLGKKGCGRTSIRNWVKLVLDRHMTNNIFNPTESLDCIQAVGWYICHIVRPHFSDDKNHPAPLFQANSSKLLKQMMSIYYKEDREDHWVADRGLLNQNFKTMQKTMHDLIDEEILADSAEESSMTAEMGGIESSRAIMNDRRNSNRQTLMREVNLTTDLKNLFIAYLKMVIVITKAKVKTMGLALPAELADAVADAEHRIMPRSVEQSDVSMVPEATEFQTNVIAED